MDTPLQLIVGLGNPGQQYEQTRHNAGADFVTELARTYGTTLTPNSKFFGESGQIRIGRQDIRLLNPSTYMNRSGQSVGAIAKFYKIPAEAILVAHDELDLSPGTARFKKGGGHGGHNGLRDIIQALGNNKNFARLRIGIGHPGSAAQVSDYVLKKAAPADRTLISESIDKAIDSLPMAASGEWNAAMLQLHTR